MKLYGVTHVLGKFIDFGSIPDQVLYKAAQRGGGVHRGCAAFVLGAWSPKNVDYQGYVDSFKGWYNLYVDKVLMVEQHFVDEHFGFQGRVDFVFKLVTGFVALVDIKTPVTESRTWKCQLAAYKTLIESNTDVVINKCLALQLKAGGQPPLAFPYEYYHDDFAVFIIHHTLLCL